MSCLAIFHKIHRSPRTNIHSTYGYRYSKMSQMASMKYSTLIDRERALKLKPEDNVN